MNDGTCEDGKSLSTVFLPEVCIQVNIETCVMNILSIYSKTCLKRNLKGPENFSAKARFPFNQGTLHTV